MNNFNEVFKACDILIPDINSDLDYSIYPVIACDQHTSEPEYWHTAEKIVNGGVSTLNMILPEIYLEKADEKTEMIHKTMAEYQRSELIELRNSIIFCERTQQDGRIRQGVICALDLECYDYAPDSTAYVRATEGTVLSRIPARVNVRRGAELELPHVMLLINDPSRSVIEPEFKNVRNMRTVYDTDLMLGGGHVKGYLPSAGNAAFFLRRLNELASDRTDDRFSVAVGDGNHSLASAKAWYEELKEIIGEDAAASHPARYALVEIVNIYSEALDFEPIHRILYGTDSSLLCEAARKFVSASNSDSTIYLEYTDAGKRGKLPLPGSKTLSVAALTDFLDDFLSKNPSVDVDYIHGGETLSRLSVCGAIGIFCDSFDKESLFKAVGKDGPLPRKTFSMGHAWDKRYYLEARRIVF